MGTVGLHGAPGALKCLCLRTAVNGDSSALIVKSFAYVVSICCYSHRQCSALPGCTAFEHLAVLQPRNQVCRSVTASIVQHPRRVVSSATLLTRGWVPACAARGAVPSPLAQQMVPNLCQLKGEPKTLDLGWPLFQTKVKEDGKICVEKRSHYVQRNEHFCRRIHGRRKTSNHKNYLKPAVKFSPGQI